MNIKIKKTLSYILVFFFITRNVIASIKPIKYIPLEPGIIDGANETDLVGFLSGVFNLGIAIAVVLTVVMIIWGGVEYMTTDSWHGKENGKEKIKEAVKGLLLALVSYLILWTINPDIVDFKNNSLLK